MALSSPASLDPARDVAPRLAAAALQVRRAAAELRAQPESGWEQVRQQVLSVVRRARRWSFPVRGEVVGNTASAGTLLVGEEVVRTLVGRAVVAGHACTTHDVRLQLDRQELLGLEVVLCARYGADLRTLADAVRVTVLGVLADVLGDGVSRRMVGGVEIRIDDITVGDPRWL